ncbi:extracellular solute-binding protein [Caldicellulosiruptoraceae bacterium PP1]
MFISKRILKEFTILVLIISFLFDFTYAQPGAKLAEKLKIQVNNKKEETILYRYTYEKYLFDISKQHKLNCQNQEIILTPDNISSYSDQKIIKNNFRGASGPVLIWDKNEKYFDFKTEILNEGFYNIEVEYYPLSGSGDTIKRGLYIDGKLPFFEALNIPFFRYWKDAATYSVYNSVGDEINPQQTEILDWNKQLLFDIKGRYPMGFNIYLTKGLHTLRFTYVDQGIAISKIYLKSVKQLPVYTQYLKNTNFNNNNFTLKIQGEKPYIKNDITIKKEYSGDPQIDPFDKNNIRLNYLGGWRWRKGNQEVIWKFNIPQNGYYKLGIKYIQNYRDGLTSYREILIDGHIPFKEFEAYPFKYKNEWQFNWLKGKNDNPYLVYLNKGTHTISLKCITGEYKDIVTVLEDLSYQLSYILKRIIMITGSDPDLNFDYELDTKIPDLIKNLKDMSSQLGYISEQLTRLNDKRPSIVNQFLSFKDQIDRLIKTPFLIPRQLKDLMNAQMSITNWIEDLENQPLGIDFIMIASKEKKLNIRTSNIFEKMAISWFNFINSFKKDYDKVAGLKTYKGKKYKTINVWVARGKEWAEIMKQLADEEFTPKTNINVNINVLPSGQLSTGGVNALLLSIVSKSYPDVACGVDRLTPVELAIRDATVNLKSYKDFNNVINRFHSGVIDGFIYRNGVYALPETMDFTVMFYRKDIIDELGIKLPNTWEELYKNVFPILNQNGMQFYYGNANIGDSFIPFLYQRGGKFYKDDYLSTDLDSERAYMAFKEWTDLYKVYKVPVSASFFNRFRTGEMPIGIAGYDMYIMLTVAAPELYGRWGIALIPGHINEEGKIDRTASANTTATIILQGSKKKNESWEFLKWWTDQNTQTRFGREVESSIGPEARWNTANMQAFLNLPWDNSHLEIIKKQWQWYRTQPVVLGGYFTNRHLLNAWTKAVVDLQDIRDSLEKAVKDINKEMKIKQKEYGVIK